jgi:uncharacterized protein YndB with AHSA1/START domain
VASKNQTTLKAEPNKAYLTITREFEAPRELVFRAYTDPKLYVRWQGPRNSKTLLDKFEPRIGGIYRLVHDVGEGQTFGWHGVYHEVTSPERIVSTFEIEGLPKGHVGLGTIVFEALPGDRTRMTHTEVYATGEDRDTAIEAGMMSGVTEGYERLDELFAGE